MKEDNLTHNLREAHKYLLIYISRLREGLRYLDSRLNQIGFEFLEWYPLHNDFPHINRKQVFRNKFIYDHFPLDNAEFKWCIAGFNGGDNEAGAMYLWVQHIIDTAYESLIKEYSTEIKPEMLSTFDSNTILRAKWFIMCKEAKPFNADLWEEDFETLIEDIFEKDAEEIWCNEQKTSPPKSVSNKDIVAGAMTVSVDDLKTPNDFENKFVKPLIEICNYNRNN